MTNLRNLKADELKDVARTFTITGAWKMNKEQLIAAILRNAALNGIDEYYDGNAETIQDDAEHIETEVDEVVNEDAQNESEDNVDEPEASDEPAVTTEETAPAPKRGALIEFEGKAQNICAWGKELGISPNTLYGRIYKMGWSVERAFTTPGKSKN